MYLVLQCRVAVKKNNKFPLIWFDLICFFILFPCLYCFIYFLRELKHRRSLRGSYRAVRRINEVTGNFKLCSVCDCYSHISSRPSRIRLKSSFLLFPLKTFSKGRQTGQYLCAFWHRGQKWKNLENPMSMVQIINDWFFWLFFVSL